LDEPRVVSATTSPPGEAATKARRVSILSLADPRRPAHVVDLDGGTNPFGLVFLSR
jgi:hypothetical protein